MIRVKGLSKEYKHRKKTAGSLFSRLLNRKYEKVHALKDINLQINEGELVALVGLNGAGKTTLLKCLTGIIYPTAGEIEVLGFKPADKKRDYLNQIAFVMGQKNQLWWDLPAVKSFEIHKAIYEIPDNQYGVMLNEIIEAMDLKEIMNQPVRTLSLGQRMKCELALALLHKPKVLFLDEPTLGLDLVMQKRLREFIESYNQKYKATVIITSHNMDDIRGLCKRIILINKGIIVYDGMISKLIQLYGEKKYIKVNFEMPINSTHRSYLKELGEVINMDKFSAQLAVPRDRVADVASQLINQFKVDDIDISELTLEEVVRKVLD